MLSTIDLRWKIDALPDPTQTTGSLISGKVVVRRKTDPTIGRVTDVRKVTGRQGAAETADLSTIGAPVRRRVPMTEDGAMGARMGGLDAKTDWLLVVITNNGPMPDVARFAALSKKRLNKIS